MTYSFQVAILVIAAHICASSCIDDSAVEVTQFDSTVGAIEDDVTMLQVKMQQHKQQQASNETSAQTDDPMSLTCSFKYTPNNDAGGEGGFTGRRRRNGQYLDRHSVSCSSISNTLLSSWQLRAGLKGNEMDIKYKCCGRDPLDLSGCETKSTPSQDSNNYDARYFDRHTISCPSNKGLRYWRMRTDKGKVYFRYTCCKVNTKLIGCSTKYTPSSDDGDGDVRYLDRHTLTCPSKQVMRYFKMQRTDNNRKYQYKYKCCSVAEITTTTTTTTTTTPAVGNPDDYTYVDVGGGQCVDEDGVTLQASDPRSLGWAQPEGGTTLAECEVICSTNLKCGAIQFTNNYCWLYGIKEKPYVSSNPYAHGHFECYVKQHK